MFESCLKKQAVVKETFANTSSQESKYAKIIELGRKLSKIDAKYKTSEHLVAGCQSQTYLRAFMDQHLVYFEIESDALISEGLAALLLEVYNGETPETILKCPPTFLDEIGISASLTPSRANGLYSMHLRMKQEALRLLMSQ